jgi:hypothetical protein
MLLHAELTNGFVHAGYYSDLKVGINAKVIVILLLSCNKAEGI